jgi:peptidoglycan hydrolase-like protein with peptidoglycan-binding domain
MRLQQPWPANFTINKRSPYGWRIHPKTGKRTFHHGIDVAGRFPVTVPADGIVRYVAPEWHNLTPRQKARQTGGNVVGIEHGQGLWTFYYHGARQSQLKEGQRVRTGDLIYTSGTTGLSTGDHLHFETRRSRRWGDTYDPVPLLKNGAPQPVLPISGRPSKQTWMVWQDDLRKHGYHGLIDGIPGPMTYRAIQNWAGVTPANGVFDVKTRKAVQEKIGVKADGVWGRITWSEIQRRLNVGEM